MYSRGLAHSWTMFQCLTARYISSAMSSTSVMHRNMSSVSDPSQKKTMGNLSEMPGPAKLPFIGSSWIYLRYNIDPSKQPLKLTNFLRDRYGDIVLESLPGGVKIVHLFKAEDFECIFRCDGQYPIRGIFPLIRKFNEKHNQYIDGLSTSEGHYWKHARSAVQQKLFQRKHTEGWFTKHLKVVDELLGLLDKNADNEGIVSHMSIILERYCLEVVTTSCFGKRLDANWTDLDNTQIGTQYIGILKLWNKLIIDSLFSIPWYKYFDTPLFKKYSRHNRDLTQLLEDKIESEYISPKDLPVCPQHENDSLIKKLIEDAKLTKQEISTIVNDIIKTSVFTLRSLLAFLLYALAKNPKVQNTIRKEITDVAMQNNGKQLSQNTFDKMPYMKAFVKETLRLYPVIPGNVRMVSKDLQLKNYRISEGTYVKMHHIYSAMSEENFENPTEFCLERWLRNTDKTHNAHPFAVTQFGFGPRSCVGKRLSLSEAYLMLTKILSKYTVEYPDDSFIVTNALQYHPPDDMRLKFTKLPSTEPSTSSSDSTENT